MFESDPFHALVLVDVFNNSVVEKVTVSGTYEDFNRTGAICLPFMHEKDMGTSRNVRVDGHREDELVVLAVEVVEVVLISRPRSTRV